MHPEHQRKCHELIYLMASDMKIEAERLYRSGGIDVSAYSPDEYALAEILVTVAAKNISTIYEPPHRSSAYKRDMKNLMHF